MSPDSHTAGPKRLAMYGTLPAYRAVLDAEGAAAPEDLLVAGDEEAVEAGMRSYAAAGVTDVRVAILAGNGDEEERSRALLRTLAPSMQ